MLCLFVFLSLSIQISTAHGSRGCCGSTRRLAKLNVNPRRWTTWTSKMSCLDPNHSARVRFQTCGNSACGLAAMDCGSGGLQTGWVTMVQPGNWDLSGLKACPRTSSHYLHSNCQVSNTQVVIVVKCSRVNLKVCCFRVTSLVLNDTSCFCFKCRLNNVKT